MEDTEKLLAEVSRSKAVLETSPPMQEASLEALARLAALGELPTKVLADSKVGVSVNRIAKASPFESVQQAARDLVQRWKQVHRKRKLEESQSIEVTTSTADGKPKAAGEPEEEVSAQRQKVRQRLKESLTGAQDPEALSVAIETELHLQLKPAENYSKQVRSIIYNLRDASNSTFRTRIVSGDCPPKMLPTMSAEAMASDAKAAERARARQEALEEAALKSGGEERTTDAYVCEKCKGKKCTYVQVTPISCVNGEFGWTSVTCLTCNNKWKA
eukprot:TRINITY_DN79370_c0_g1_i1.p2 TRINITY_DN79370_c0_g1~~TRINITY_DN79370_c0_g1_i1.p2  ORF type:complete len:273 (+),score=89.47 TRINITY_DN79370_c0_g1_i1:94-912(+)